MHFLPKIIAVAITALLAAYGGENSQQLVDSILGTETEIGGNVDETAQTTQSFRLYPTDYFEPGYEATYELDGWDSNGETYTGRSTVLTDYATNFEGTTAVPVRTQSRWYDASGAFFYFGNEAYYAKNPSNRRVVGAQDLSTGEYTDLVHNEVIPQVAEIGDTGVIADLRYESGLTTTYTSWKLESAPNGKAKLIIETEVYDFYQTFLWEDTYTLVIDHDGRRDSYSTKHTNALTNLTVYWQATKIGTYH